MRQLWLTGLFVSFSWSALAADTTAPTIELSTEAMNLCLQASVVGAAESMTVAELKQACVLLHEQRQGVTEAPVAEEKEETSRVLQKRMTLEALNRSSRFVLTPHKRNYLFPLSFTEHPNTAP